MGILLAVIASLSYVSLDILRKVLGPRLTPAQIVAALNLGAALVCAVMLGITGVGEWDRVFVAVAGLEVLTHTGASLLYVQAVTLSPLSLTIPYLGLTPVVSAMLGALLLGEIPSRAGMLGIVLVLLGALALPAGEARGYRHLLGAPFREPGSWRMLLVAGIWGTTTSLDKIAIAHASEGLLGLALTIGSTLLLAATRFQQLTQRRNLAGEGRRIGLLLLLAAALSGAAILCQFLAYRKLLVAYVETIKRAGGLLSVLLGGWAFQEQGLITRLPAAVLILSGVALILLG